MKFFLLSQYLIINLIGNLKKNLYINVHMACGCFRRLTQMFAHLDMIIGPESISEHSKTWFSKVE